MSGESHKDGFMSSFRRIFGGRKADEASQEQESETTGAGDDELVLGPAMQSAAAKEDDDELVLMPAAPAPSDDARDEPTSDDDADSTPALATDADTDGETVEDAHTTSDTDTSDAVDAESAADAERAADEADDEMISTVMEMIGDADDTEKAAETSDDAAGAASADEGPGGGAESIRAFLAEVNEGARDSDDAADQPADGGGEPAEVASYAEIGASTIQSRCVGGLANATLIFALPGSTNAVRTGWEKILRLQLDAGTRPCNFVELIPRLRER